MSSHSLDASGQRPLTTTMNDPARTAVTTTAKAGDDAVVQFGGFSYYEFQVPPAGTVELVTRRYTESKMKLDDQGDPVREDGKILYEDVVTEVKTLRLTSLPTLVAVTVPNDAGFSSMPHTSVKIVDIAKDPYAPRFAKAEEIAVEKLDIGSV